MADSPPVTGGKIPLRIIVSVMIGTMGVLLGAFLAFAGVRYLFAWPGIFKSIVCGVLLAACLVYGIVRGDRDFRALHALRPEEKQVGLAHVAVIMGSIALLTALVIWINEGWPYVSVPGPLGR